MTTDSSPQSPRTLSRRTEIIFLVIYCICFSFGGFAHIMDLVVNQPLARTTGPAPGTTLPFVWNVISTSFAVFNPLTVVLLLVRRQAGIALMLAVTSLVFVMNLELMVQWWIQARYVHYKWLYLNGTLGLFQLVTAPWMWRTAAARSAAPSASPAIAG
jgi:hypothetical protein